MNKLTRLIAVSITSMIAVGVLAAPAMAAEEGSIEDQVCDALAPHIVEFTDVVAEGLALLEDQAIDVDETRSALDASTTELAAAALAWIQALDADDNVSAAEDAFVDAAGEFGHDATDWLNAVDDHAENTSVTGLNEVVLNYMEGICS
jgi:hypothetical protein